MKKNDIAILIVIVAFSLGVAFLVGQAVLGGSKPKSVEVETVEVVSADVVKPDPAIFNKDAINPSVSIKIGNTGNGQPFGQ